MDDVLAAYVKLYITWTGTLVTLSYRVSCVAYRGHPAAAMLLGGKYSVRCLVRMYHILLTKNWCMHPSRVM